MSVDGVSHLLIKLQYVKRKLFDDNTKTCETPLCNFLFYGAQSQSSIHSYIQYKILQFVILETVRENLKGLLGQTKSEKN